MADNPSATPAAPPVAESKPGPTVLNQTDPTVPSTPPPVKEPDQTPTEPPKAADTSKTPKSLINEGTEEPKAPAGAPEKYADFTAPEGFEIDQATLDKAIPIFKELNLPQEAAQKLVSLYTDLAKEAADGPVNFFLDKQKEWVAEIKADPVIGGKLDDVRQTVSKALLTLGDPKLAASFKEAMDYTGAGNNPAFIRVLYAFATKLTEGGPVTGAPRGSVGGRPESAAKALYPNLG